MPAPEQLVLEAVEETENDLVLRVRSKVTPRCPACTNSQVSYHSQYLRTLRDLPWQGRRVRIQLQTRRFRCHYAACKTKIFAERLPDVAAPRARRTARLREIIGLVGYAMGGLPGSRLLSRLGMPSSHDTVLRRVKAHRRQREEPAVRVLGVDGLGLAEATALWHDADGSGAATGD